MEKQKKLYCSECGAKIKKTYFKCQEKVVVIELFEGYDIPEANCFCSKECFCEYMELTQLDVKDNKAKI